jgi:hypothetical protein
MMRALATFAAPGLIVNEGDEFPDDHPVIAGREILFAPSRDAAPVERATALPGEKRATVRPKA